MSKFPKPSLCLWAAAFAATLWGFRGMLLDRAPAIFRAVEEDMSYAWFVPLFSLYVIWCDRKKIIASISSPALGGLVFSLPFLVAGILGARGLQVRFEILAFSGMMIALPWMFAGRECAKKFVFPSLFLLFCIPLNTYLDIVTVHLRLFATSVAFAVLKGFGAEVVKVGTMVGAADGSFSIDVAAPCSGLRSIFALMALTAGYAYFNQPTWFRRALLFSLSIPIAILGNVMRILTICLVAQYADEEFATGFYHDYSGYVVFIVAIMLMISAGELISRCAKKFAPTETVERKEQTAAPAPHPHPCSPAKGIIIPIIAFALVLASMCYQSATPDVTITEPPAIALPEMEGYSSVPLEPSESELTVLPPDTAFLKKLYTSFSGQTVQVNAVIGGKSKSSIHRPELCLPSQGFLMTNSHTVDVNGTEWRFITVKTNMGDEIGFAYTFFNQDGYRTVSHMKRIFRDILDRTLHNRIDRWVMITINSSRTEEAFMRSMAETFSPGKVAKSEN